MSRQFWEEAIAWATADGTAVASTVTETIIFPNITIPANYMQDGRGIILTLYGRWGTTAATPTLTFRVRWGGVAGTVLVNTGAIPTLASTTAGMWGMDILLQTRSNGATGTIFGMGKSFMTEDALPGTFGAAAFSQTNLLGSAGVATPAAVTVDLTADTALSVTATWGTSHAANTVTGHLYVIESLN